MAIGHDSFKGMSIDFGDVNDDGIFDMSVSNIGSPFALQEAHFLWTSTGKCERSREVSRPGSIASTGRRRPQRLGVGLAL